MLSRDDRGREAAPMIVAAGRREVRESSNAGGRISPNSGTITRAQSHGGTFAGEPGLVARTQRPKSAFGGICQSSIWIGTETTMVLGR